MPELDQLAKEQIRKTETKEMAREAKLNVAETRQALRKYGVDLTRGGEKQEDLVNRG